MKKKKHFKKPKNLPYEKISGSEKTETFLPPLKEETKPLNNKDQKTRSEENQYAYTKKGDTLSLVIAAFFSFMFLAPAISVGLIGNDQTAALVCIAIGLFPLRYVFKEIYSIKVILTKTEVEYYYTALFKKPVYWKEPLEYYSGFSEYTSEDNSMAMLWHSSDDSKNVILYSKFYKYRKEVAASIDELRVFLKNSRFGKKQKFLQIDRKEEYTDRNFFEIYNQSKNQSRDIKQMLFPDRHVKILKDESHCFWVAVNKKFWLFSTGLILLATSFSLLPFVYRISGVSFWCFILHLTGILLFTFGVIEQTLKIEKRCLSIGNRWFKRKIKEELSIPLADIISVEVAASFSAAEKQGKSFHLQIKTKSCCYEFGKCSQKEELDWLCETIVDRLIKINDTFFKTHRIDR